MYEPSKIFMSPDVRVEIEPWRKALLDAAEIIRKRGWCQKDILSKDGRVCAVGAIKIAAAIGVHAMHRDVIADQAYNVLHDFLKITCPVAIWNDRQSTTASEVIQALEGAARS